MFKRRISAVYHDVTFEIENFLELTERHVEKRTDSARQTLQKPDMRDGRGEFDMSHALPAHLGLNDFDTALIAHDARGASSVYICRTDIPSP